MGKMITPSALCKAFDLDFKRAVSKQAISIVKQGARELHQVETYARRAIGQINNNEMLNMGTLVMSVDLALDALKGSAFKLDLQTGEAKTLAENLIAGDVENKSLYSSDYEEPFRSMGYAVIGKARYMWPDDWPVMFCVTKKHIIRGNRDVCDRYNRVVKPLNKWCWELRSEPGTEGLERHKNCDCEFYATNAAGEKIPLAPPLKLKDYGDYAKFEEWLRRVYGAVAMLTGETSIDVKAKSTSIKFDETVNMQRGQCNEGKMVDDLVMDIISLVSMMKMTTPTGIVSSVGTQAMGQVIKKYIIEGSKDKLMDYLKLIGTNIAYKAGDMLVDKFDKASTLQNGVEAIMDVMDYGSNHGLDLSKAVNTKLLTKKDAKIVLLNNGVRGTKGNFLTLY